MFDEQRAARQLDPILGEFFGGTVNLTQSQIDFLIKRHGVPAAALGRDADGGGMVIGAANVTFDKLFDWPVERVVDTTPIAALVFVARAAAGDPLDLVAWAPRTDQIAARFGRASVLGEHALHGFRVGSPPRVHRAISSWLRAGRDGVVIIDPRRAGRILLDVQSRLVVEDQTHADEIAGVMSAVVDLSKIVVPTRRSA